MVRTCGHNDQEASTPRGVGSAVDAEGNRGIWVGSRKMSWAKSKGLTQTANMTYFIQIPNEFIFDCLYITHIIGSVLFL
jgi:hypothetical protein